MGRVVVDGHGLLCGVMAFRKIDKGSLILVLSDS
jgi:hypothetical protein